MTEKSGIENGSYHYKELLGCDGRAYAVNHNLFIGFCLQMMAYAVRIAEEMLNQKQEIIMSLLRKKEEEMKTPARIYCK